MVWEGGVRRSQLRQLSGAMALVMICGLVCLGCRKRPGADCNGRRTVNGPVVPAIPSAGPGAPRTDEELGAAIRGYGERARGR